RLDATAQADLVRRREVKPIELVDAAIRRIERLNPTLNAVVTPLFDEARALAADPPPGRFRGVPFLMKDLQATCAGVRHTAGSRRAGSRSRTRTTAAARSASPRAAAASSG